MNACCNGCACRKWIEEVGYDPDDSYPEEVCSRCGFEGPFYYFYEAQKYGWGGSPSMREKLAVLRSEKGSEVERLFQYVVRSLKAKVNFKGIVTGVINKRRHYIFGGWAKHGTYPVKLLRVFRRGKAFCEERYMDEHMQLREGRAVEFDYDFVDHNLNSFEWWKEKHRGYAKREAMDAMEIMAEIRSGKEKGIKIDGQAAGKRAKKYKYYQLPRYFRAVLYFCLRYFAKGGFLDGRVGWKWNFWQGLWYRWIVDREIGRISSRPTKEEDFFR